MAKKQTRRSVSVSRTVYDAAAKLAAARGVSIASLVEAGLRMQGLEAPEGVHYDPVSRSMVADIATRERFGMTVRQALAVKPVATPSFADVEQRAREHEQHALEHPCRAEYCRITGLHAADDPRHSKKIAARSLG